MNETAGVFKEVFRIRSYEVGPDGYVTVPTLCNYLQEIAGNHAAALEVSVEQLGQLNMTWVLTRLKIEFDFYPQWKEEVTIETWPSGENGLFATREFLLFDTSGRVFARASSHWLLIDIARRRPIRIPSFISEIRVPSRGGVLPDLPRRYESVEGETREKRFEVRYADLDLNRHVNNVKYVEWALESVPPSFSETRSLRSLDITFRSETVYGDEVTSRVVLSETEGRLSHDLVRVADLREAARAESIWIIR